MTYSIGNRVSIPPKEYNEEPKETWVELFDEFFEEGMDFKNIRDNNFFEDKDIPNPEYFASLYLQTSYEDFCRGASTRSIIDASRSKNTAKQAEDKWKDMRNHIQVDIKNMVAVMEEEGNKVDMTIQYLQYFCEPYVNDSGTGKEQRFNDVLNLISGILLRTILQESTFASDEQPGRLIANELIKTFSRRLSRFIRQDIIVDWIRIYKMIQEIEDLTDDELEVLEKELKDEESKPKDGLRMSREKFQVLINNDKPLDKNGAKQPNFKQLLEKGIDLGAGDKKEEFETLAEKNHRLISKQYTKIAYNLVMLLVERGWFVLRAGDFNSTAKILGISEEKMKPKQTYPAELSLSDKFYREVWKGEESEEHERNAHPLFKYFTESRDRWSYVEPEPHIFDEKEDVTDIILNPPPAEHGKWTPLDQLFADDRIDFDHPNRIKGTVKPQGYLTGTRKFLRDKGTTDENPGGGYKILQQITSKNEEYKLLGSPAYDVKKRADWYDLSRNPQTVGRERGVANKETVDALNHIQKTQYEINLHLLNAIAELTDKSGNTIDIGQMLSDNIGFEQLRDVHNIELWKEFVCPHKGCNERFEIESKSRIDQIQNMAENHLEGHFDLDKPKEKKKFESHKKKLKPSPIIAIPDSKTQPELYREWMNITLGTESGDRAWVRKILALNDNVFWNVWTCDWRGRILPRGNILSPQGADLDRALLRFKQWKPLGEKGWDWLRVYLFNLMKREWFEEHKPEELENYKKKCPFEHRIEFIQKQLDEGFFQEIAEAPLDRVNLDKWQDKPAKKGESLQYLSTILEVNRIHRIHVEQEIPYEEIQSGLPIALDASNNGYQHLAALLGNRKLAEAVNIVPPDNPAIKDEQDLYQKVAEEAMNHHNDEIFSDWNKDEQSKLVKGIFSRKFSKKPTMTLAYGSKDISRNFEGNSNGNPKFLIKRYVYFDGSHTCYEKGCDEKFVNNEDLLDHLEDKHFPREKYYIREVTPERIEQIPPAGISQKTGSGMINIDEEDDFETRRVKHIRNLNYRRSKTPTGKGTEEEPYAKMDDIPGSPTPAQIFYIENNVKYSFMTECIENYQSQKQDLTTTINSIKNQTSTIEKNIQKCIESFDWADEIQDLSAPDQIDYLEQKKNELIEKRIETIRTNSLFESLTYPGKYLPVWHENSLLYTLFEKERINIPEPSNQSRFSNSVSQSFRTAIGQVTDRAFNAAEKGLKHLVESTKFNLVTWTSPTGFRVRHIYPLSVYERYGTRNGIYTGYWTKNRKAIKVGKLFEDIISITSPKEGSELLDKIIREAFSFKIKDEPSKGIDFQRLEQIFLVIGVGEPELPGYLNQPYSKSKEKSKQFYEAFLNQLETSEQGNNNRRRLLFEINKKLPEIDPSKELHDGAIKIDPKEAEERSLLRQTFANLNRKFIVQSSMNPKRYLSELTVKCNKCDDEGMIKCPCIPKRDEEKRKELKDSKRTTVNDLKKLLKEEGKPTSGPKDDLVNRFMETWENTCKKPDEGEVQCSCPTAEEKKRAEYKNQKVAALKETLEEKELPTSGKKHELVERLIELWKETKDKEENECGHCKGKNSVKCDEKGCDDGQKVKQSPRKDALRGITPNFIHSLDAAHLTKVINTMCGEGENPTSDFWAIHDCFAVHPGDTERLRDVVKEKFVEVHTKEDGKTHKKLSDWLIEMHPQWNKPEDIGIELPEPDKDFKIQDVKKSEYMIS